jgi:TonB family protein
MDASSENKNKYLALAFTLGFHALLFLLFLIIVFITPIPPFEIKPVPEIEIGLGMEGMGNTASGGSGENDPNLETSMDPAIADNAPASADNVVTDDTQTDVTVKNNPDVKETPKPETEVLTPEEKREKAELEKALAKIKAMKDKKGKGDGGKNTGGTGNGTKDGVGDGPGTGIGDGTPGGPGGTGWDLKGRSLLKKPDRMTDSEEEGKVIVEIIVDETGKVIKATPGLPGSTTTSSKLYAKARGAAKEAKFSPSPGTGDQRGTYTFVFTLE